jgi:hypothetical protein
MAAFLLMFAVGEGLKSGNTGEGIHWTSGTLRMAVYFIAVIAGTMMAWWRDMAGGVILTLTGIVAAIWIFFRMSRSDYGISLVFALPFFLSGILLLFCSLRMTSGSRIFRKE